MIKNITVLLLAAIASTAIAQQTFQPKHPGILARQMDQKQMKIEVAPVQKQTQTKTSSEATRAVIYYGDLQLDSVVVTKRDDAKTATCYEYHPNGKMAKSVIKRLYGDGSWIEVGRTEWTEDYPLKGSSMTEFSFDTLGVYGAMHKMELHDDYGRSYLEYSGTGGELKPVMRLSATLNENNYVQSEAYYYYDENGKELPEDSIVYTYDEKDRLVRETYFLADKNGQLEEQGYFETTYTEVETPSGPGTLISLMVSNEVFRQDSIYSNDQKYQYYAYYTKENQAEWQIREERASQNFGDTDLYLRFRYNDDNTVLYGQKYESEYKDEGSRTWNIVLEYSCGADTTQWLLLRKIEDVYDISKSEYGREESDHKTFIYEADAKGELHDAMDALISEYGTWKDEYTYAESTVYDDFDEELSAYIVYYYHDPNSTGISSIEAQAKDGVIYDLSGRRLSNDQRGAFMIKKGRVVVVK